MTESLTVDETTQPWTLRRDGHDNGWWLVLDEANGVQAGVIFKYTGAWWVGDTTSLSNRNDSKEQAANMAWERHISRISSLSVEGVDDA